MIGKAIARYQIQSEIGRGGMAAVYLAYDPSFRRNVAIKVVSVNLQDNLLFKDRFEREAHLIARIEHPAIVPVYDFGEQDGQSYLIMRYMPGGSLTEIIKDRPMAFREAARIISQIAPALDAVHAQGIVHRDLKPGNILFDSFGNPAISDFGIAHFSAATSDLTGSAIIGTPSYMSPEQVRGDEDLDGRSDIYALGVILFEMLTGRGPFRASTPMSVALKHLTEPVPSIRSFRADLPQDVEHILNKALAKERETRYSKASDLASELSALLNTFPDQIAPGSVRAPDGEEKATEVDVESDAPESVDVSNEPSLEVPSQTGPVPSPNLRAENITPAKGSSRKVLQIVAIAGVGLFLLFLCGSLGLLGTWASLGLPGFSPASTQTASPTLTAAPAETPRNVVLFSDDFSDPLSGWPVLENSGGKYSYQSGGYHILVNRAGDIPWATIDRQDDDLSISVDARALTESINGYYGLLCRMQDAQNFYYFVIQQNGDFTIGKYKNGEPQFLFSEGWRPSHALPQGDQMNRLRADCVGTTLRFSVNDVLLGEVTDTDFTSGSSGLVASALDAPGFEVLFDNFVITEPE